MLLRLDLARFSRPLFADVENIKLLGFFPLALFLIFLWRQAPFIFFRVSRSSLLSGQLSDILISSS